MGLKDFFDRLASFDTETTGVDTKNAKIWQTGFTKKGVDAEYVVNPFFVMEDDKLVPEQMKPKMFSYRLKQMNGIFSETAFSEGHFNKLIELQKTDKLNMSLDESLDKTLGRLKNSDVLVMQNHNFENKLLLQNHRDGLISNDTFSRIQSRMEHLGYDGTSGNLSNIFQVPTEVEKYQRYAQNSLRSYRTSTENQRIHFNKYTEHMNTLVDKYEESIRKPKTKTVVVEQMDITKALYANAISAGLMDSRHTTVGLSMNFLTENLLGHSEKHTALSDSKDTTEVFKKTWSMIKELRTGMVSDETRKTLVNLNKSQYTEVQKQFKSTVHSVLNDFSEKGYTKYQTNGSVYQPSKIINDERLKGFSTASRKTTNFDEALENILESYSDHDNQAFRESYIKHVKSSVQNSDFKHAHENLTREEVVAPLKPESTSSIQRGFKHWTRESTTLFGKEISKGSKYALIGGAVAGLGLMVTKDAPEPPPATNAFVAEDFYDPMYLGTDFVNFNNRNKHYMY